jgi:hypothetical protein
MKPKPTSTEWLIMMQYDHQCNMDPTMPLKYPCTRYNIHLATLLIINLYTVMMSQSGDITHLNIFGLVVHKKNQGSVQKRNPKRNMMIKLSQQSSRISGIKGSLAPGRNQIK